MRHCKNNLILDINRGAKLLMIYGHCLLVIMENSILTNNIQKWEHRDLILGLPCSIYLRCPQVWQETPEPSGLKNICLFEWKPIDFYWKCLSLLWPWQRSNWPGWCMFGRSSIDVPTPVIKIFLTQRWQLVPPSKVPNVKTMYDPSDLENNVKVKFMICIQRTCHQASLV